MKKFTLVFAGVYLFFAGAGTGVLFTAMIYHGAHLRSAAKTYELKGYGKFDGTKIISCDKMITSPFEITRGFKDADKLQEVSLAGNHGKPYSFHMSYLKEIDSALPLLFSFVLTPKDTKDFTHLSAGRADYTKDNMVIVIDNRFEQSRYMVLLKDMQNEGAMGWTYRDVNGDGHLETKVHEETKRSYILIGDTWHQVAKIDPSEEVFTAMGLEEGESFVFDVHDGWVRTGNPDLAASG